MGDHHSLLLLIMNLKHKRIQHTFDQIFQAFMVFRVEISSKTAIQVLIQVACLMVFTRIFQAFNAGVLKTIPVHSGLPSQEFSYLFPNRLRIRADLCSCSDISEHITRLG
jgi:hypothetical protein